MIRRPPRSTQSRSSAASDVYKRQERYFQSGNKHIVFEGYGTIFGVEVCEDSWYAEGPHRLQSLVGDAELIIVVNASPFHAGKWHFREEMVSTRTTDNQCFFVYGN